MYSTQSIPDIQLSVGLGDSLKLILLLDGVRVGRSLSGVDELIGKTLGDGLGVVESGFTGLGEFSMSFRTYC
jgi:hypothetical protein